MNNKKYVVFRSTIWFLYSIRWPFESYNSIGFFAIWSSHSTATAVFMLLYLMMVSSYIGLCRYIRALFHVLESDAHKITQSIQPNAAKNQPELRVRLVQLITFHLEILQFMDDVQRIMSGPFFKIICTYALFIGHSLNSQVSLKKVKRNKNVPIENKLEKVSWLWWIFFLD